MKAELQVHSAVMPGRLQDLDVPKWRDSMVETAIQNLRDDGELDPTLLCVSDVEEGPDAPTLMSSVLLNEWMGTEQQKDQLALLLPMFLRDIRCRAYVLIIDSNVVFPPEGPDANGEALLVSSEHADLGGELSIYRYERDADGKVSLVHPPTRAGEMGAGGRFTNLLPTRTQAPQAEA
jgi:hypothetical protein